MAVLRIPCRAMPERTRGKVAYAWPNRGDRRRAPDDAVKSGSGGSPRRCLIGAELLIGNVLPARGRRRRCARRRRRLARRERAAAVRRRRRARRRADDRRASLAPRSRDAAAAALARRRPGGHGRHRGTPTAPRASPIAARRGMPSSRAPDVPHADDAVHRRDARLGAGAVRPAPAASMTNNGGISPCG